jgi:hypothetical protein
VSLTNREVAEDLGRYIEYHGPVHGDGCPEDDTCDCEYKPLNDGANEAYRRLSAPAPDIEADDSCISAGVREPEPSEALDLEALARETMERLFDKAKLAYYTFDGEPDHTLAVGIIRAALARVKGQR